MNEEISVLQAIYSEPNELIHDEQLETIQYNGKDYSVTIYLRTGSVMIDSSKLSSEELKKFRSRAILTTTIFDLLNDLQLFYEDLLNERQENKTNDEPTTVIYLFQIDHMRSPTIYMKHLKQWTNEGEITGRVLVVGSREIYLLIEGNSNNVKVSFFVLIDFQSKEKAEVKHSEIFSQIENGNSRC